MTIVESKCTTKRYQSLDLVQTIPLRSLISSRSEGLSGYRNRERNGIPSFSSFLSTRLTTQMRTSTWPTCMSTAAIRKETTTIGQNLFPFIDDAPLDIHDFNESGDAPLAK